MASSFSFEGMSVALCLSQFWIFQNRLKLVEKGSKKDCYLQNGNTYLTCIRIHAAFEFAQSLGAQISN